MRPGPPKEPLALRQLKGTADPAHLAAEPQIDGDAERPYGLKARNPAVAKLWDEYAPLLQRAGLLTKADELAFLHMLYHAWLAEEAMKAIEEDGLFRRDENGVRRKHPGVQIVRDATSNFRAFANEFGMTPSARTRLAVEVSESGETLDQFFARLDRDARLEGAA